MTKEQALEIIKLLSALESWAFSNNNRLPDYLHEQLCSIDRQVECGDAEMTPDHILEVGKMMPTLELAELLEQNALMPLDDVAAAELRRLHALTAQDEALLRQALEALEFFRDTAICEADTAVATEAIVAMRERLGVKA